MTIDETLKEQGYRIAATYHTCELLDRASSEIRHLQEKDYQIVPVDIALGEQSEGIFRGMHYIYIKEPTS